MSLDEYLNRIPDEIQDKEIKREHITRIASCVKSPRHTGRCLNLSDSTINRWCGDHSETAVDHAYNIIMKGWFEERPEGTNPTYRKLVTGLHDAEEDEAIKKLLQLDGICF